MVGAPATTLSRLGRDTSENHWGTLRHARQGASLCEELTCGSRQPDLLWCRSRLALLRALPGSDTRWVQLRAACCALLLQSLVPPSTHSQVRCYRGCTNALLCHYHYINCVINFFEVSSQVKYLCASLRTGCRVYEGCRRAMLLTINTQKNSLVLWFVKAESSLDRLRVTSQQESAADGCPQSDGIQTTVGAGIKGAICQ